MKRKLFFLLIPAFCFTTFTGVAQERSDWQKLSKRNYKIDYPKDWQVDESGQFGTDFMLLSQLATSTDQFRENINLVIQDLSDMGIDLDQFVALSEGQLTSMFNNCRIIESSRKKREGKQFHKILFTAKQGMYDLKFQQYYWLMNDEAYILTFTCEEKVYDDYKELGESIMDSFGLQ